MQTTNHKQITPTQFIKPVREYQSRHDAGQANRHLVQGYTQMVTDRIDEGWSCHLITFLFFQLPGTRSAIINQMRDEVQRVYSTFVTRVHRKPRNASPDELPILIGAADLPVYKRDRSSSSTVLCNGGLHFHALLLVAPGSRLEEAVDEHFSSNEGLYRGRRKVISAVHLRPVTGTHERVVDYLFKTVLRGSLSYDEGVMVLPRARQELTEDGPSVGHPSGFTQ